MFLIWNIHFAAPWFAAAPHPNYVPATPCNILILLSDLHLAVNP